MLKKLMLAALLAASLGGGARAQQDKNVINLNSPTVSCGSTATLLAAARYRNAITIPIPSGGVTVYIGSNSAVTTSNGFPVVAGAAMTLSPFNGSVYCVVAAGTQSVTPLESY